MLLIGKLYKEEKQKLFDLQKGICPICGRELTGDVQQHHLDHDHALDGPQAGKVRGLLCNLCNGTEGIMKHKFNRSGLAGRGVDYIEWMQALLDYLKKDYSDNNIHPQLVKDKTKQFTRLSKDDMIAEMTKLGYEVKSWETKEQIAKSFQKQFKKSLR
ncbi:packaging and recombination endonuclease VII [Serratia phage 4S]|nr:packaging and recombination endonuclease VII [Serratia phage 4S]